MKLPSWTRTGAGPGFSVNGNGSVAAARPSGSRPALVSVVIPVLNQGPYIGAQLEALSRQTYTAAWEILVVDNGSSDHTTTVALSFSGLLPGLRLVDASDRRGLNYARGVGARVAKGDFLAYCDGDDVVSPGWLEGLVSAAEDADIVGGPLGVDLLNHGLAQAWRRDEPLLELAVKHDFLPAVPGGNCGMWAAVAHHVGFDADWRFGGSDIEFSWRTNLAGYRMAYAPDALVHMRFRSRMRDLARQWFAYGASGGRLYRRFRAHGMRPPPRDELHSELRWLISAAPSALRNRAARGRWVRVASFRAGRLAGSIRWRVWFP